MNAINNNWLLTTEDLDLSGARQSMAGLSPLSDERHLNLQLTRQEYQRPVRCLNHFNRALQFMYCIVVSGLIQRYILCTFVWWKIHAWNVCYLLNSEVRHCTLYVGLVDAGVVVVERRHAIAWHGSIGVLNIFELIKSRIIFLINRQRLWIDVCWLELKIAESELISYNSQSLDDLDSSLKLKFKAWFEFLILEKICEGRKKTN